MQDKVVELDGKPRRDGPLPVSDFWFAQLDLRLGKIEFVVNRLERQIWLIVCGAFALVIVEAVKAVARAAL
jgi:hypothetical protein